MSIGGWAWHRLTGQAAPAALTALGDGDWHGTTPLSCGGNDQIDVKGVQATFTAGSVISASGNCHVTCTDCVLKGPTAAEATGNGQVTLINGSAAMPTSSGLRATRRAGKSRESRRSHKDLPRTLPGPLHPSAQKRNSRKWAALQSKWLFRGGEISTRASTGSECSTPWLEPMRK